MKQALEGSNFENRIIRNSQGKKSRIPIVLFIADIDEEDIAFDIEVIKYVVMSKPRLNSS